MYDDNVRSVVELARDDIARRDFRRAKDRLRAVLRESPHLQSALEMMGQIYFEHGDHRNAVMYWCRANRWDACARQSCEHVFTATGRALNRENPQAARYQLYAFAGSTPPQDLAERLALYQNAYFRLDEKRSRFAGISCVPLAGGIMLAALAMISVLLGGSWTSLAWVVAFSLLATVVVFAINTWLYLRARMLFNKALEHFKSEDA